jgi:hypothetical protein
MDDAELRELGEDIRKNGLREKIKFRWIYPDGKQTRQLYDGRNRLEAMERRVTRHAEAEGVHDDLARIIRLNIRRRHLTKEQKVELIVSARKAAGVSDQVEPKLSKRGRKGEGRKPDPLKVVVLSDAKAAGISEATQARHHQSLLRGGERSSKCAPKAEGEG